MEKQMKLTFTATIVEKPREGISPRNGRRWARVTVGGYLGDEFIKTDIGLPEDMSIEQFKVHEEWDWPISFPQGGGGEDRKVYIRLRADPDGRKLLRKTTLAAGVPRA